MRILFIHTRYLQSMGGEDTTVAAEMELLISRGHTAELLLFQNEDVGLGIYTKIKTGISSIYNSKAAAMLQKTIARFQPDIIHIHNLFFSASPSIIVEAAKNKIPVVFTIQNFRLICANSLLLRNDRICELCVTHDFPWYGVKYRCYHDSALQSAAVGAIAAVHKWLGTWKNKVDLYITPSEFARRRLINSSLGIAPAKMIVKRNFIKDPMLAIDEKRKPFYLFIGRLSVEKGLNVLLDAWERLPNDSLLIAGDGPAASDLREKYRHLNNVSFLGKKSREEVFQLLSKCRALIFPSIWYEGLPLTIIEAFATATPVIASSVGAMKEMIIHEQNGLLFETGNATALSEAVSYFNQSIDADDSSFYENARNTYLENYHPDKSYQTIIELYSSLIKRRHF